MFLGSDYLQSNEGRILLTIVIGVILYILRFLFISIINKKTKRIRRRYLKRQIVNNIFFFTLFISIGVIWYTYFTSIFTFLGLVLGALVIVSKEFVLNILANMIIIWRELFKVGDRIEISGIIGDVVESGPLFITLSEIGSESNKDISTGNIVKVPNNYIFTNSVKNYSRGSELVWDEIIIDLNLNSNVRKAKDIMLEIGERYSDKYDEKAKNDPIHSYNDLMFLQQKPMVSTKYNDGKVRMTLNYLCKFYDKRERENQIWEDMLERFNEEKDILGSEK